jgi:hypothetical protein
LVFGLLALLVASAPIPGLAQDAAPIPMPRPADRMPQGVETLVEDPALAEDAVAAVEIDRPAATASEAVTAVAVAAEKQRVTLTAQITENGMNIPDGLVWRVFDTRTDASGELALVNKSEDATATFELVPGEYVVHVAYGRAQASETIEVPEGGAN